MKGNGHKKRHGLARVAIRCQPDSRLVKLVREGHDPAFEEIVRRYRPSLVAFAGAIVPQHHAEDVVQEALTRAHAALATDDAEMNLRPWLFTIVRNGALNSLRNEPVYGHLDENYDGVPQPPEVAARREELAALTASVSRLPRPQREALVKRELEGRSHEEIAASLGVSPGAVRGLIYRARTALRDGAGLLIPLPLLRTLLSSAPVSPEATGAAGAAAAGLAGGGGGVALKAGATLGVAVIAVGSGIAVQHRNSGQGSKDAASGGGPSHPAQVQGPNGSNHVQLADSAPLGSGAGREAEGSLNSGPGGGRDGSPGSSSGSGHGGNPGGGGSSSPGPGSGGRGDEGGSGGSSGGDGGSSTSGHGDGGGSSRGGGDEGTSGGGGADVGGGSSGGSGSGGDGSGDGGSSGSGGGDGSSGSGSGDDGEATTTPNTTTTTTTSGGGDDATTPSGGD